MSAKRSNPVPQVEEQEFHNPVDTTLAENAQAAAHDIAIIERDNLQVAAGVQTEIEEPWKWDYSIRDNANGIATLNKAVYSHHDGKDIYYGGDETSIIQPSKVIELFSGIPGETSIVPGKTKYTFALAKTLERLNAELGVGDIVNARVTAYMSLDQTEKQFFSLDLGRKVCMNGAIRTESFKLEDIHNMTPDSIIKLLETHFEIKLEAARRLQAKQFKHSYIEKEISDKIQSFGVPKKFADEAQYIIYREHEALNAGNHYVNGWLIYNGFNNALFRRSDSSLTAQRKVAIDARIVEYLEKLQSVN